MSQYRNTPDFWGSLDTLVHSGEIVIDRPKGTRHPKITEFIYPLDYGYINGILSSDGEDLDIWMGTSNNKKVSAVMHVIDVVKRDTEMKILYACTTEELDMIYQINNERMMHGILIQR